ncbi:MAG: hypothetical protein CVV17_13420 [Gammaproteobacteria bacterium HGW-Gammaproteobacteria-7]|nr:MAG: hypothetical protein CVV17_13420 [Gammaproteobacteria bacterium HGW-Gammaproteobacteria-7]
MLTRDLRLVWRRRGDALQPAMFAVLTITLFPLALGSEPQLLARIASGVIWVAVVLAGMLSLDALFRSDLEDGSLEQLLLSPQPLGLLIFGKVLVHWLTTALPVLIATLELGGISERDVPAVVNKGDMDGSLLGMAYLSRFSRVEMTPRMLVLER